MEDEINGKEIDNKRETKRKNNEERQKRNEKSTLVDTAMRDQKGEKFICDCIEWMKKQRQ